MKPEIEEIRKILSDPFAKYRAHPVSLGQVRTLLSALAAAQEENKGLGERLAQKGMEYLELHKKSQSLWGALRKYGRHLPSCRAYGQQTRPQRCDCGFISALSRTEKEGG
ncbi:hypothetical protein [Candidatus Manganitrophus noduliformans]|uniref:Uncharacterized protein n=1 Tax=Candidatus Manganitrophus noduliformans TaxID=2606439 RepID=A0A7X6DMW8_9BACT|nr:hypothetical protein [Candidatus Manganitrophus noduliformans]NKE69858.1 hypothetical protein [Candidatus Manganitrophus noduliformans]